MEKVAARVVDNPVREAPEQDRELILDIEGLVHRLEDRERGQEFVVTVKERLSIRAGSFSAILGPNACGKSTLLSVLGLLRRPTNLNSLVRFSMSFPKTDGAQFDLRQEWNSEARIVEIRRRHLGFALQNGELLASLTVEENIALPMRLNSLPAKECRKRVDELLNAFGLLKGSKEFNLPQSRVNKISGGEFQRVALARAIAHRPGLVFVDEPTASLNRVTAREALSELRRLQADSDGRTAVVMITHDETLAKEFADQIIRMRPIGPTAGEVETVEENVPCYRER